MFLNRQIFAVYASKAIFFCLLANDFLVIFMVGMKKFYLEMSSPSRAQIILKFP